MGSPVTVGRDGIRLQRMPRSVALANDLIIPPSHVRDLTRITSPLPSPTGNASAMSRPTILGLALALPADTPPPGVVPANQTEALQEARILSVSRAHKTRRWRRAPLTWHDTWHRGVLVSTPTAKKACDHWEAVQRSLLEIDTTSPLYSRLNDGIRVTSSMPCLTSLRPPYSIPKRKDDVFSQKPAVRYDRQRIVSEKVSSSAQAARPPNTLSIDDSSAAQRRRLWNELVQAKALCDTELDKTLTGLFHLSDELLDPVDPDTTSVVMPLDAPMPLAPIEQFASIAAEIRTTSLHTLLERTDICSSAISNVQSLGTLWEAHPDWPGRGWYVELLLTLAALSRVLEWWNAEHCFWTEDHACVTKSPRPTQRPSPRSSHVGSLLSRSLTSDHASAEQSPILSDAPVPSPLSQPMELSTSSDAPPPTRRSLSGSLSQSPHSPSHLAYVRPESPSPTPPPPPTSSILLELTLDLHIQFVSTAWHRIFGTDPSNVMGAPVSCILANGDAALLEEATHKLLESAGHTVEVALDVAVAGTSSAHQPMEMTAQGMLAHHHATRVPSHTMWVLHARQQYEPSTGEMRFGGAIGGLPDDASAISTDLVLCRICESDVPAWFFAKHSEICHEIHRLELTMGTCNETLWALIESVAALRSALLQNEPAMYRDGHIKTDDAGHTLRLLDDLSRTLRTAMSISTPELPDNMEEVAGMRLLSPPSNANVLLLKTWQADAGTDDPTTRLLCEDATEAVRNKIRAVKRMCNTIVYVETVRRESEEYVTMLLDDSHDATLHMHDDLPNPPVIVDTPSEEVEDTLAGVGHMLLDPVDDASDDDAAWSRPRRPPIPIPGAPSTRKDLLSTPPLSPHVSSSSSHDGHGRSLAKSPRFGVTPNSPHVLPPVQARTTASSIRDFELLKPISKGAYGSVFLARKRATGDLYAIKILKKSDMIAKNQITNVRAERMILMNRTQSPFVVKLFFTFQSPEYLYLVMEYLPGGDCGSLVKTFGALPEEWAQQYLAEMVQGLDYLHSTGVVHRDMKPDNLLIDRQGHLKLTDFGLSKLGLLGRHRPTPHVTTEEHAPMPTTWAQPGSKRSLPVPLANVSESAFMSPANTDSSTNTETFFHSMSQCETNRRIVGTPDYLAPESILGVGMDDFGVDWWAVGVILFEFLHGYPPFHASTPSDVFDRILSRQIAWDADIGIPPDAHDLIDRLLCMNRKHRLGANGVAEIKAHAYFDGIDWDHLTDQPGPFVPQLDDAASTDYFDARGAVPQLWQDDDRPQSAEPPGSARSTSSGSGTPNEFGSFSYKNLPVLKQANDEMLRRIRMECAQNSPSSPAASVSSTGSNPIPTTPSIPSYRRSWSERMSRSRTRTSSSMSTRSDGKNTQRHVLLADINPVSRHVLQHILTSIDAQTTLAMDGADLVQLAMGDTVFDAVFIKLGMHGVDAQDGARMIKCTRNVNASTPIVAVVTGDTQIDVAGSVFDAVLQLPSSPATIASLLSSLHQESSAPVAATTIDEATPIALAQLAL